MAFEIEFERTPGLKRPCFVRMERNRAMGMAFASTWLGAVWLAYRYLLKDEDRRAALRRSKPSAKGAGR